jgi:hypothetical protein
MDDKIIVDDYLKPMRELLEALEEENTNDAD